MFFIHWNGLLYNFILAYRSTVSCCKMKSRKGLMMPLYPFYIVFFHTVRPVWWNANLMWLLSHLERQTVQSESMTHVLEEPQEDFSQDFAGLWRSLTFKGSSSFFFFFNPNLRQPHMAQSSRDRPERRLCARSITNPEKHKNDLLSELSKSFLLWFKLNWEQFIYLVLYSLQLNRNIDCQLEPISFWFLLIDAMFFDEVRYMRE